MNPTDTLTAVDRDTNQEIRYCSPNSRTKSFALVQSDGSRFRLDPPGNAQAAALVRTAGKRPLLVVNVTGGISRHTIQAGAVAEKAVGKQEGGTHADEIETSIMLYIAPDSVDMSQAVKDYHPSEKGGLTRDPRKPGAYSARGIYGDATLATRAKGEAVVNAILDTVLRDIQKLAKTP